VKFRAFDVVVGGLLIVFMAAAAPRLYPRFVHFRGAGHDLEFAFYGFVILAAAAALWWAFRRFEWEWWILVLTASGVLLHIAASSISVGEGRLYDMHVAGLRFDKIVHFYTAFVTAVFVQRVLDFSKVVLGPLRAPAVVLIVLGVGASWEIVEYLVLLTIPHNGVGDYHNNLTDLIANLVGSLLFLCVPLKLVAPRTAQLERSRSNE
jgi:uncharacterized membrane protein YjdF